MTQQELENMVRSVVRDMVTDKEFTPERPTPAAATGFPASAGRGGSLDNFTAPDIGEMDLQSTIYVENPKNRDALLEMKRATPARLGVGRAGPRPTCKTLLRFRADHAGSMDAVFNDVSEDLVREMDLLPLQSLASTRQDFLMDPNLGRTLNKASIALVKEKCQKGVDVQIIVADGLSSTAVEANIRDLLPAIVQGVKGKGLSLGTNVFVKFGRVGVMDHITELVNSKVTINLIGERPGLVTGESYSAYITYAGKIGMPEAGRTVVSNIYRGGTPPAEAGAHIADLCKRMMELKISGMDLK